MSYTYIDCQNFNPEYENNGQQCSESQVWEFYKKIVDFAEGDEQVVGYFPFGFMHDMSGVNTLDQLMDASGGATPLGSAVMNLSFQK
jgi:hypothetical protein